MENILKNGNKRIDRTGFGTISIFGAQMRFNIMDSFPLLTTKNTFFKGVIEELLWFIKGDTDSNNLSNKGVHIWDKNGAKQFLENMGFHEREQGDLGPIYGFQWRHFNAK